jgi:atypical dual specificity phosphatase
MDATVIMGVAPVAFAAHPATLRMLGVRGVGNLCDEFRGPVRVYEQLGVQELWLPTIDHHEPSLETLKSAVKFISRYKEMNQKVYVHCKAGHGRSAAVVFCWLFTQLHSSVKTVAIVRSMESKRKVRKNIHLQSIVSKFCEEHARSAATRNE